MIPIPTALDIETASRLRVAVGRLSRRLRRISAGAEEGLTPTKVSVLLTIVREGPLRLSALAGVEGLNPTMLSRVISHLVDHGLVTRASDDGDRRTAWVQATDAGQALARQMRRERTDALNEALEGLAPEHRRLLEQALPALEALAERMSERRP